MGAIEKVSPKKKKKERKEKEKGFSIENVARKKKKKKKLLVSDRYLSVFLKDTFYRGKESLFPSLPRFILIVNGY